MAGCISVSVPINLDFALTGNSIPATYQVSFALSEVLCIYRSHREVMIVLYDDYLIVFNENHPNPHNSYHIDFS